ncbi:MAG: ankyrin repeat domain-containing protein, partial [Acidobacteria bacterium]
LLDERDDYGRTLLMGAACNNDKSVVEYLLENGRDVNAKDSDGWTALMYAEEEGHDEIVEILLQAQDLEDDDYEDEGYEDDDDYDEDEDDED